MVSDPPADGGDADAEREAARLERELRGEFDVVVTPVRVGDATVQLWRPESAEALISEEQFVEDERLPYWADLWPSALALAGHVHALPGEGRTLLELGCGLGLVSAVALERGFDVTATDYYEDALRFAALNAARHTGTLPRTRHVDWRALPPDLGRFDVVVASDVLYERPYAAIVAHVFARTLEHGGEGWLTDPGRVALGAFVEECERRGLRVERVAELPYEDGAIRQRIALHRLDWRRGR